MMIYYDSRMMYIVLITILIINLRSHPPFLCFCVRMFDRWLI